MRIRFSHDLEVNVTARTIDRSGNILQEVQSHNVVVNAGRKYLRDLMCCTNYGQLSSDPPPAVPIAPVSVVTNHRIRYVGVGTGSVLQSNTYPGMGAYSEIVTVAGLERPVLVNYNAGGFNGPGTERQWLKQVEPQDGAQELPDDYTAIYRAIFGYDEISCVGQIGEYEMSIPVTEFMLFTSAADAYAAAPTPVATYVVYDKSGAPITSYTGYTLEVPGAFAYNATTPIVVTPAMMLEVLWELRS
jgi:hypothetical protein